MKGLNHGSLIYDTETNALTWAEAGAVIRTDLSMKARKGERGEDYISYFGGAFNPVVIEVK